MTKHRHPIDGSAHPHHPHHVHLHDRVMAHEHRHRHPEHGTSFHYESDPEDAVLPEDGSHSQGPGDGY
jgi:hypothetical protein